MPACQIASSWKLNSLGFKSRPARDRCAPSLVLSCPVECVRVRVRVRASDGDKLNERD